MTTVLGSIKSKFEVVNDPFAAAEYEQWLTDRGFDLAEDLEIPADQVAAYQRGEVTNWLPEMELYGEIFAILAATEAKCLSQLERE